MINIKINVLPNVIFILAVVIVPACFVAIAAVSAESDSLMALAGF